MYLLYDYKNIYRRVIRPTCLLHAIIPTLGGRFIANDYSPEIVPNRKSILEKNASKRRSKKDIHMDLLSIDASGNYQLPRSCPRLIKPSPNYSNLSPP